MMPGLPRSWVALTAMVLACSSEAPSKKLEGAAGTPTTGGAGAAAAAGAPTPAEVHEAEVRALLGKLGPVDAAELARRRAAPILETHLGVEADGSFEGRMRYAAVNAGPSALEAVAFDVPAN